MTGASTMTASFTPAKIWAVSGLFLLSGLSSLIYQVIWTRMLVFVFGSTTFATSTVLAVFMGGLALGSFLAGKYADKARNPFLLYGILEAIIGIWALAAPFLFGAAVPVYKMFFDQLHLAVIPFGLLRFCVAAIILGPPTACMGATLPLLSRFVTDSLDKVGDRVGRLYAINTLGAVLGSVCGGFILLPELGLNITILIAASINVLLGLAVWGLSKKWQTARAVTGAQSTDQQNAPVNELDASGEQTKITNEKESGDDCLASEKENSSKDAASEKLPREVLATMICFSVSGALAMIYEVAWTRTLLMVIGSTTYAFTIMLSTFLIGIFLGSFVCARYADRLKSPIVGFAIAEVCLCLCGFISLFLFNYLPYENLVLGYHFGKNPGLNMIFRFLGAGMILTPITICLGVIFPLAVKVCARDLEKIGSSVGQLYSINTIGAIIGAFLCGFAIIPILGTEQTLIATSVANLVLGVVLLVLFANLRGSIKIFSGLATLFVVVWAAQSPVFWDYNVIVAAQPERRVLILGGGELPSFQEWRDRILARHEIIFYKEGLCANVTMRRSKEGKAVVSLLTNGHVDASDGNDMENQATVSVYPLLLKPDAPDVCVVGWGSGVTAGFALQFPIKSMVCAEIEPVVLETSKFFHHVNYVPENDKRSVLEPSDGRNYLLGTSRKFDVIVSEPSNPWQAGVCNLFTKEYFQICNQSLKPGGIFTFWTQIQEVPSRNLAQVFAALKQVFPVVFLMRSDSGDVAALAFREPVKISVKQLKESLAIPSVRASLLRFNLTKPEDFLARIVACPAGLESVVHGSEINSDDTNHLEYEVSRSYENKIYLFENREWLLKNSGPIWDFVDWGESLSPGEKAEEYAKVAHASLQLDPGRAIIWAEQSLKVKPNANALATIAEAQVINADLSNAEKTLAEGMRLYPEDNRFVGLSGVIALGRGDYLKARQLLSEAVKISDKNFSFRYYLASAYSPVDLSVLSGVYYPPPSLDAQKVIDLCAEPCKNAAFLESKPATLIMLADAYRSLGKYQEAIATLEALIQKNPNGYLSWRMLGETYAALKDWKKASFCFNRSFLLVNADIPAFIKKAKAEIKAGNETAAIRQIQLTLDMAPANSEILRLLADYARENKNAARFYASLAGAKQ